MEDRCLNHHTKEVIGGSGWNNLPPKAKIKCFVKTSTCHIQSIYCFSADGISLFSLCGLRYFWRFESMQKQRVT